MPEQSEDLAVSSKPMSLLIATGDQASIGSIGALFANASPEIDLKPCAGLEAALATDRQTPVVLPVWMPLEYLRRAIRNGDEPAKAIESWCDMAGAILRNARKARRRLVVIDASTVLENPAALSVAVGDRLDMQLSSAGNAATASRPADPDIFAAVAATLLASDEKMQELAEELEAMIVGPVTPRTLGRDEALKAAQDAVSASGERKLLRESLAALSAEAEAKGRELADAAADNGLLKAQIVALEQKLAAAEEARKLREEVLGAEILEYRGTQIPALERKLAAAEEALKRREEVLGAEIMDYRRTKVPALERKLAAAQEALKRREEELGAEISECRKRHEAELRHIYASTSWRVSRPVRTVGQLLRRLNR